MMNQADGIERYRQANLSSVSPIKLIVLLYEAIIRHSRQAKASLAAGDQPGRTRSINASQAIVTELRSVLNHSVGGQVSQNLESLYDFIFQENLKAILSDDPQHLDNVEAVVSPLLTAWRRISESQSAGSEATASRTEPTAPATAGPNPANSASQRQTVTAPAGSGDPSSQPAAPGAWGRVPGHKALSYSA
jgi:flagellar protein FliS